MKALELKIPPPVVVALVATAMWLAPAHGARLPLSPTGRLGASVALLLAGFAFAASGVMAFRRAQTTINPRRPEAASTLVTTGVYRITRNPMYVGLTLALVAWAAYLGSAWALLGPVAFVLYIDRFQIAPEERVLATRFGSAFDGYRARVRRWI